MAEQQPSGQCPLCRGSQSPGETTFTVDLGYVLIVVRHVPGSLCDQCGASFIDDAVAAALEEMVEKAKARRAEVAILSAAPA